MFAYFLIVLMSASDGSLGGQFIGSFESPAACQAALNTAAESETAIRLRNTGTNLTFHCVAHSMTERTKVIFSM